MVFRLIPILAVTAVTARVYLSVLRSRIDFRDDKRLPAGVATYFGWGLLSIPLVIVVGTLVPGWQAPETTIAAVAWNHILLVGVVEEFAKWVIFAVVMHRTRGLRSPEDGIIMAAAVALAFATVENVGYALRFRIGVLWFRSVAAVIGHMTYAAIWGYVWSSITWDTGGSIHRSRLPIALAAVLGSGIIHGLFNTATYVSLVLPTVIDLLALHLATRAYRALQFHSPYRTFGWHEADLAIDRITAALRQNPKSVELRTRLGYYLLRARRFEEAERAFRRARRAGSGDRALPFMELLAASGGESRLIGWDEAHYAWATMDESTRTRTGRRLERLLAVDGPMRDRFRSFVNPVPPWERNDRPKTRGEIATERYLRRTREERDPNLALRRLAPERVDRKRAHLAGAIDRTKARLAGGHPGSVG